MKTEIEKLTEELLRLKTENEHNRNESDKRFDKFQEESRTRMDETTMQMKETVGNIHYDFTDKNITRRKGDIIETFLPS